MDGKKNVEIIGNIGIKNENKGQNYNFEIQF